MLLLKGKSLWSSPITFRNYSLVVTSCIALLHLKDYFLVDSTKNEEDRHKAFRNKHTKSGAVCDAQQPEGNCASLFSLYPSNYVFLLTRKLHSTSLVPVMLCLPSTPKVGEGRGGRGWGRPALLEGEAGRGQRCRALPSFLPPLFFLKFIAKGQHSRVRHVTLTGPAYSEPDHPRRGRWSCLIETGM